MSFASEAGYLPMTIEQMMLIVMDNVNTKFSTTYTEDTFLGTNFYKYFYALIQKLQENEVKTSEIVVKLQEYFIVTNEMIQRPNTTHPGVYDYFLSNGYFVSTKPPIDIDAGKAFICVDVDDGDPDYALKKKAICNLVKNCIVAGVISQGTEVEAITLSNDQSFDFKYNLPNKIPVLFKLTITLSENNQFSVSTPEVTSQLLLDNINARYKLGKNFEPQRYFSIIDAPWASQVLLEWSDDDGGNWNDEVYESEYDEVFTYTIDDIEIVED